MTYQLIHDDIVRWAVNYTGPKFHSLFCDPPYHLTTITKRFGKSNMDNKDTPNRAPHYKRLSKGFMGQTWDGGDIAFNPETWAAMGEHLCDGGFGMAFASSRGWHRLACAIEDAGFIIHPSIFGWCFLSGFPKATRIKNEIFESYRYGLQAMKPALEPIILFQKPYVGRPVDNITGTGAGALNIDGCRIALNGDEDSERTQINFNSMGYGGARDTNGIPTYNDLGRWPANLILDNNTCKVLRLRYNISDEIKQVIREYFNDNSEMRTMSKGISSLAESTKEGQGEILQPGMLREMVEPEYSRRKTPNEGQEAHPGSSQENDGNGTDKREQTTEREFSSMEGRQVQDEGLLDDLYGHSSEKRAGEVSINGNAQQPSLHPRTQTDNGSSLRKAIRENRSSTSQERDKGRQSAGKFGDSRQRNAQNDSSTNNKGVEETSQRKRVIKRDPLEVAETSIPPRWLKYFEDTGKVIGYGSARLLDLQSGELNSGKVVTRNETAKGHQGIVYGTESRGTEPVEWYGDSGGASRMFFQSNWQYEILEQLENADPLRYEPKVSTAEREAGLDSLPARTRNRVNSGGYEDDPKFAPTQMRNHHPCAKPIKLTKYLATLLLPPDNYSPRRILVPFSGSGSEGIGCLLAGWEQVTMIEQSPEYHKIAEQRLKWWSQWPNWGQVDVDKILNNIQSKEEEKGQLNFFDL